MHRRVVVKLNKYVSSTIIQIRMCTLSDICNFLRNREKISKNWIRLLENFGSCPEWALPIQKAQRDQQSLKSRISQEIQSDQVQKLIFSIKNYIFIKNYIIYKNINLIDGEIYQKLSNLATKMSNLATRRTRFEPFQACFVIFVYENCQFVYENCLFFVKKIGQIQ